MASDSNTFTPSGSTFISDELAENYDALVADENRNLSYDDIVDRALDEGDVQLARWARKRAAGQTEPAAEPEPEHPAAPYEDLKVDELKELAVSRQIDVSSLKLKADLVDALVAWDKAQPAVDAHNAAAAAQGAGA